MIEKIANIGCIVFLLLLISGTVVMCVRNGREKDAEKRRNELYADSIAQRRQFVADSIDSVKHSPEYIARMDSLRLAEQKEQDSIDRNTMVMIFKSDSLCHYSTICSEVKDIKSYQFTSQYNAKQQGKKICPECEEREDYYWGVKDGEYIYFEDD